MDNYNFELIIFWKDGEILMKLHKTSFFQQGLHIVTTQNGKSSRWLMFAMMLLQRLDTFQAFTRSRLSWGTTFKSQMFIQRLIQHWVERNQHATAYVGNLDPQIVEELLWELVCSNMFSRIRFCGIRREEDVDYAIKVLNMIELYREPSVLEANGAVGAPIPPLPFANGPMPPAPVPPIQLPPMHPNVYPPMWHSAAANVQRNATSVDLTRLPPPHQHLNGGHYAMPHMSMQPLSSPPAPS
ncbi:hypothetical protein H5410_062257 [Solanum commersonii]|uniref:Uncharacterized protein n=1 Tax=Solanum commersonii TaxID=4109 RepID=A0A9J5W9W9_SOLCO|nr:hypothetical protein H5410_062257 [Solanum commersonii]